MTQGDIQVSDSELHALVDGQLKEPRRSEVAAFVAKHPEAASRVADYRRINRSLHALYDPVLSKEIPPKLSHAKTRGIGPHLSRVTIAAGLVLFGGVLGWTPNGQLRPDAQASFAMDLIQPAAFAHAVYTPEVRHPVEVGADEQAHLVKWLSKRLKTNLHAPDLRAEGFELVGGRLLPSTGRMAAQFMYQDSTGKRVTLYARKGDWANQDVAFRYTHEGGIGVFFWIDDALGYALVGEMSRGQLLRLAKAVYEDLDN